MSLDEIKEAKEELLRLSGNDKEREKYEKSLREIMKFLIKNYVNIKYIGIFRLKVLEDARKKLKEVNKKIDTLDYKMNDGFETLKLLS